MEDYKTYWNVFPTLKTDLFEGENGYYALRSQDVKKTIHANADVRSYLDGYKSAFSDLGTYMDSVLIDGAETLSIPKTEEDTAEYRSDEAPEYKDHKETENGVTTEMEEAETAETEETETAEAAEDNSTSEEADRVIAKKGGHAGRAGAAAGAAAGTASVLGAIWYFIRRRH